jgi:Plasmid recombination enzyme
METVQWLEREYGDKIVRAELHLDEATPHIHAFLVPIDEKGQLNCRDFFGQRKKMFALQDSYAQAMKPLGLERGQRESRATHTSVKKYYSVVNEFCDGGVDSVIANLKFENAQLTAKLRESVAEVDELQVERDELRKQLELKAEMSLQITLPEVEKFGEVTSQSAADTQKYYPIRAELLQWWETSTGDTSVEIDALGQRLKSKYEDENPSPATMPNDYKSDNVSISIADKERFNRASEPQQLSAAEHIAQQREKNRIEMTRNRSDERPRSRGR